MQKQVNKSKEIIKDALFKLMDEKDFEDITMSQIAKESSLVRMTVYRHFKEKNHILIYAFNQYIEMKIEKEKLNHIEDMKELIKTGLRLIKESPYTKLLADNNLLNDVFGRLLIEKSPYFAELSSKINDDYIYIFIVGGIDNIAKEWIINGMKESYEEISDRITNIIVKLQII